MDTTTLLIIILLVLVLFGGGWYGDVAGTDADGLSRRSKTERMTQNYRKQTGALTTRLSGGIRWEPPTRAPFGS
jgi:hypothetical protein